MSTQAKERILAFDSEVAVTRTGILEVTESITVRSEGRNIKRGIYRDIPTSYPHQRYGHLGFVTKTPIEVESVTRNGQKESWHTKSLDNGKRLFIGAKRRNLKNGEHRYVIKYRAYRQLRIEDEQARLYWNVTGNGWRFPINRASFRLNLPEFNEVISQQVWTGPQGSKESNARFSESDEADIQVKTSQGLMSAEGMTVMIKFATDGLIVETLPEMQQLVSDNKPKFTGLALLTLSFLLLFWRWWAQGRDPIKRPIAARFKPVETLSAAGHRVVLNNKVDPTCFSVAILSLAIKGWISIEEKADKKYELQKLVEKGDSKLSEGEEIIYYRLIPDHPHSITLGGGYSSVIESLRKEYDALLQQRFADRAHQANTWPLAVAGVVGLVGLVLWYLGVDENQRALLIFGGVASLVLGGIVSALVTMRKSHLPNFAIGFAAIIAGIGMSQIESFAFAWPILLFGLVFSLFIYLMPAPKTVGQRLIEQIEGFRLYLSKAEHESLKRLSLPEKTPQLYEELLPYAIALDLETEWSDQFTRVLERAEKDGSYNRRQSHWYHGSGNMSSGSSLAGGLAAGLASSVVASSVAPSSSSSGGGGGFSGGGGGGGGGGGW